MLCVRIMLWLFKNNQILIFLEGESVEKDSLVQFLELENPSHRLMPSSSSLIFSNFYPLSILMLV